MIVCLNRPEPRQGVAIVYALVVLAVIGIFLSETARNNVAIRRMLDARQNQLQATWLARVGLEMATARLMESQRYDGEVIEWIADSQTKIKVEAKPQQVDVFQVVCEARFPATGPYSMRSVVEQTVRRTPNGGRFTVERFVPEPTHEPEPPLP